MYSLSKFIHVSTFNALYVCGHVCTTPLYKHDGFVIFTAPIRLIQALRGQTLYALNFLDNETWLSWTVKCLSPFIVGNLRWNCRTYKLFSPDVWMISECLCILRWSFFRIVLEDWDPKRQTKTLNATRERREWWNPRPLCALQLAPKSEALASVSQCPNAVEWPSQGPKLHTVGIDCVAGGVWRCRLAHLDALTSLSVPFSGAFRQRTAPCGLRNLGTLEKGTF